ncbi:hypothetical protein PG991_010466 [Apiospora marii]|uniref:Uncharacterized protein n=1 Tax=Apiospora marii TaxID=335849 RepID=A0ABR1RIK1_9PEZI
MAPQDKVSAPVNQMDVEINDISSDSDSDTPTGTSTTSPDLERAADHPMADLVVDASSASTATTSKESSAAKRSVEDANAEAGPATKRQKSSSCSDAFPTVKAKQEERSRRKKLMADQVEAEHNEWKQANEGLTKKKKLDHKKEVMKRVSDEFMARDEHPDQIVVEKSSAKPKDTSTPAKTKVASVGPAPQASPAVADERAAHSTSSTPQVDAASHLNVRKPEKAIAAANPDEDAKGQTPKKSGTKAAKQQAQPATPKDRKKLPASKKPDSGKKNSIPDNNNDGKVLIDGTADFVSNNLVEKAQSDALETIVKANEKANEIRKEAEEQAAQVIADARTQVDEKVRVAGEEAAEIVKNAEGQQNQVVNGFGNQISHHPMHPPARAASVPNYENKVFKLKQEEGEN